MCGKITITLGGVTITPSMGLHFITQINKTCISTKNSLFIELVTHSSINHNHAKLQIEM